MNKFIKNYYVDARTAISFTQWFLGSTQNKCNAWSSWLSCETNRFLARLGGLTNRQVAQTLHFSVRLAENEQGFRVLTIQVLSRYYTLKSPRKHTTIYQLSFVTSEWKRQPTWIHPLALGRKWLALGLCIKGHRCHGFRGRHKSGRRRPRQFRNRPLRTQLDRAYLSWTEEQCSISARRQKTVNCPPSR